jgi:hypothetical protein
MVTNRFRTIGFMQLMRRLNMHSQEGPIFVFLGLGGGRCEGGDFFFCCCCNQCVPTVFPIDSNQVLKIFPFKVAPSKQNKAGEDLIGIFK